MKESRKVFSKLILTMLRISLEWPLGIQWLTLHKEGCFPLRISSVNVNKFAGKCGLGLIYRRNRHKKPYFSWSVIVLVGGWLVKGVGLKFFVGRDYRLLSKFRYHVLKFGIKVSETFNLCFVTDNASICTIKVKNWGFFP